MIHAILPSHATLIIWEAETPIPNDQLILNDRV